jgi:hypothetical protein
MSRGCELRILLTITLSTRWSRHIPPRGTFDAEVVDGEGNRYLRLDGYRTAQVPSSVDTEPLKALQDAMYPQPVIS